MSTSSAAASAGLKTIKQILPAPRPHWVGDGFNVFPVFANKAFTQELSPFLMFDYASPKKFPINTGRPKGVGQHPHRGFETVTLAFQGEVEHADSLGNVGVIGSGDVQWMTAARGIIHQEFHSNDFSKRGGVFEMCQLWLNLPAKDKMTPPKYQEILKKDIDNAVSPLYEYSKDEEGCGAKADLEEGCVRVIAGKFGEATGPASTFTQVDMWDITINSANKSYEFQTVAGNNVIVFVRRGEIEVQGKPVGSQGVAIMKRDENTKVVIEAKEEKSQVLVLAGEPIEEPISAQGPFVMNTRQEIMQANMDFQSGNFGT
ncbi:hypothetical protein TrVE_jg3249 [Triparma verrucosa]|uniref:Pirin n=1 Tax=Triparma verrucosa TaxID=1606542 RepID=A0A9W7BU54_9STRA|nr:hypothetical protein TrVE_jg3249 [Triparma verrucosa]